jgi:hypothetical protein
MLRRLGEVCEGFDEIERRNASMVAPEGFGYPQYRGSAQLRFDPSLGTGCSFFVLDSFGNGV